MNSDREEIKLYLYMQAPYLIFLVGVVLWVAYRWYRQPKVGGMVMAGAVLLFLIDIVFTFAIVLVLNNMRRSGYSPEERLSTYQNLGLLNSLCMVLATSFLIRAAFMGREPAPPTAEELDRIFGEETLPAAIPPADGIRVHDKRSL